MADNTNQIQKVEFEKIELPKNGILKISDFIEILKKLKEKHGDVEVRTKAWGCESEAISEIECSRLGLDILV